MQRSYRWGLSGLSFGLALSGIAAALSDRPSEDADKVDFNRDVRPILSKSCWPCHGIDPEILKSTGNMRLTSFEGAVEDRGGGRHALVPGSPEKSLIIARVTAEESIRMPPTTSGIAPLTPAQVNILKKWIQQGGAYSGHWAFEPPKMPAMPKVSNEKWVRNPVDRFVLERLDKAGLKPEKEADRTTLIRRLSLALTGLPPTPQEVRAFLADKSTNAYDRLLDRLLASPRYGENQARYWLDAVRYADTHGLHIDNERAVFPYRDWIVRAFNEDLPFDKFTLWQIGGDLYPKPTLDQMIATGYVRMNPTTAEGGVIEAEFLANNTFDRVDTTATVFMGLTMGCAKCHDHKYDPISIKDYYSMYAFFNSTQDPVLDGNLKLHQPVMKAPTEQQSEQLSRLKKELENAEQSVNAQTALAWLKVNASEAPVLGNWEISAGHEAKSFDAAYDNDFGPEPNGNETSVKWSPFELKQDTPKEAIVGKDVGAAYVKTTITSRNGGQFGLRLGSDDGIKVWVNGELIHANKVLRPLAANQDAVTIKLKPGANEVLIKVVNAGGGDGIYFGLGDAKSRRLGAALTILESKDSKPEHRKESVATFLELGPETEAAKSYRKTLAEYRKLDEAIPFTYIAKEMTKLRPTFVLKRGNYETPGEPVDRNIPKVFGNWTAGRPKNRLGLAQWLVDKRNPLTARVIVNRIWQQHFGNGLVPSSEDFGSRGEWPSHPALLDFLAVKFVEDRWSIKKLHKLILTSAAYRQVSSASVAKRNKDPENRLISRGPRFRLDAEVVRDQALYAGGILVEKPGGRGDKVYQPAGLWEAIAYPISDTARYVQDKGDALYRRSLYLFWKRTSPPPTMMIFDAPMRESCVVQRSRTNTPTQALVTLNETGFVESARNMAERVMKAKPATALRIDFAFRLAVGRSPSQVESKIVTTLFEQRLAVYRSDKDAAKKLLTVGDSKRDESLDPAEHAAWTLVCNAILNLDEVLTLH